MPDDTLYEVLGVGPDASSEEIRTAFRRLSKKVHPDQGGSDALFRRVQVAYETLSDSRRRAEYDRALRTPKGPPAGATGEDTPGWVRVDGVPRGGWGAPTGDWTTRRAPAPPPPGPSGSQPFLARHPAGTVAVAGVLLASFGGASDPELSIVGFFVVLMGLLAMAGTGRADRRQRASEPGVVRAPTGRFFSALGAGVGMCLGALSSLLVAMDSANRTSRARRSTSERR